MKKTVVFLALALMCSNQAFALQSEADLNEKLASIGFGKWYSADPKTQISKLFENYTKYSNRHNLKKVRSFYDEKYVNSDGFDLETYFELVSQTWDMYPDMEYESEVKNIVINGDYATVQTLERAKGNAKEPSEYLEDKGSISSSSEIIYYLKKAGNRWVILSDSALSEKTFLKYGDAKNVAFDVIAPGVAVAGTDYSVLFAADVPKDKILLGSITNEKITYPTERPKEVFRKLKEDGMLERFVTANTDGFNEQAVVAVGITKAEINEEMDMKLSVSGVAFLMTRVNVVQPKKINLNVNENEKSSEL